MTQHLNCTLYYSMVGEPFNIYDRNTDPNLVKTKARIEIFTEKYELVPAGIQITDEELFQEELTRLQVTEEIKGGSFYTCETKCIIVNGKNQILKLGHKYRLDIKLYRSHKDPGFFSVLFKDKEFNTHPEWVSF